MWLFEGIKPSVTFLLDREAIIPATDRIVPTLISWVGVGRIDARTVTETGPIAVVVRLPCTLVTSTHWLHVPEVFSTSMEVTKSIKVAVLLLTSITRPAVTHVESLRRSGLRWWLVLVAPSASSAGSA